MKIKPRMPLLLFVGRFVERKGLPLIQSLAQRLPEFQFVLIGWGPLDPEQWRCPNVRVLRGLRGPELRPWYQIADLLILPSQGEGFPLVVQEAMACGTPALVGTETAEAATPKTQLILRESVSGQKADLLWANKIRAEHPSFRAPLMRSRVALFARRYWDWDRCAGRYRELMQDVALQEEKTR